jgi:predicted deacylase
LTEAKAPPATRISSEIDFDVRGAWKGYLRVPHSTQESAYGVIPVPVAVFANGTGPTVLLMAGNHGDEFEGQIALAKLMRSIDVSQLSGRLIVLPSANFPAAESGLRNSPLDNGNLNRCFPGDLNGSPTSMIAHYIEHFILPRCDVSIDLHSGGASLLYAPCILARYYAEPAKRATVLKLIDAFAAPYAALFRPVQGETRTMSAAAERAGVVHLNMELGGAGMVDPAVLQLTERGIRRVLEDLDMLPKSNLPRPPTRRLMLRGAASYLYGFQSGFFEPYLDLRQEVCAGEAVGALHAPAEPWKEETILTAPCDGIILCRRVQGVTRPGDCLVQVAADFEETAFA